MKLLQTKFDIWIGNDNWNNFSDLQFPKSWSWWFGALVLSWNWLSSKNIGSAWLLLLPPNIVIRLQIKLQCTFTDFFTRWYTLATPEQFNYQNPCQHKNKISIWSNSKQASKILFKKRNHTNPIISSPLASLEVPKNWFENNTAFRKWIDIFKHRSLSFVDIPISSCSKIFMLFPPSFKQLLESCLIQLQ